MLYRFWTHIIFIQMGMISLSLYITDRKEGMNGERKNAKIANSCPNFGQDKLLHPRTHAKAESEAEHRAWQNYP